LEGNIYHTGDWKIDKNPVTGSPFDYKNYQLLKDENIDLLIGDSTNAGVNEISRSESELDPSFDNLFNKLEGRIIVTCFSSNIARLKTIISNAIKHDKKIFVVGRSIKRAINTAIEEKLIENFEILNEKKFQDYNKDKVLLICTGSQGEKNSALWKIANNIHNQIKLSTKDNIIFSSKEIPGNEKSISYLKNSFSYLGLNIISDEEEFVHVSGHPGKNEIKEFYSFIQPKSLIPMHGEYLHLKKHLEIAKSLKIEKTNLLLSGDLCQLDLVNKNHKLIDQFVIKKLPVVQNLIIEEDSFINERGKILHNGVVSINLILNKQFDIIKFQISDKGFPFSYNKEIIQDEIKDILLNKILFIKEEINENILIELVDEVSRKTYNRNFSLKPELLIHISLI
jgi:ribonuclease J